MTQPLDDDVLLAALGTALAPDPVEPGPEAMAALYQALDTRRPDVTEDGSAVVIPFAPPKRRSATWAGIHRLRHPVAAAVVVGVLATSGVAAAGVATDHLPGPTRSVAYALGLPVTSPALQSAKGTMNQLSVTLAAHNLAQVRATAALLRTELAGLSAADRGSIRVLADDLLTRADSFDLAAASGASSSKGASTGLSTSSDSGTPIGTTNGGMTSSNGESTSSTGDSSGRITPGTSGSADGSSGGTTPGTSSPGTTEPSDGSSGGSTPTTTPGTTPTTEPGDGSGSKSTTGTTLPISPS